jgi:hypothetical protein
LLSKRDGLEKAVYRIEQAIKRSKTQSNHSDDEPSTSHLQTLLSEAQGLLPKPTLGDGFPSQDGISDRLPSNPFRQYAVTETQSHDDHFSVDDAENPLQLLARASDLSAPTNQAPYVMPTSTLGSRFSATRDQKLRDFFGPFRPSLDVGPDIDPIELGLVTEEEAAILFAL